MANNQNSIVSIWENPDPYLDFDDSSPERKLTTDEQMAEDQNVALSILEDNYYPFHDYYFHARNDNDEPTTDLEIQDMKNRMEEKNKELKIHNKTDSN
ncbi:unnamed protein product [Adineta steineri]|uniref:Uncharacterized protein n=1 Tax=Adineta steineri TaxID=433720 RepID=A0A815VEI7_9BILA|nr:unnamed protein product [Adineta steineri]